MVCGRREAQKGHVHSDAAVLWGGGGLIFQQAREAQLRHLNDSYAACLVPGQSVPMYTPIALKTVGALYFGGTSTTAAAILEYSNTTGFHAVVPPEGSAAGGQNVTIHGNFTRLGNGALVVSFGGVPAIAVHERTESELRVQVPPL